MKHVIVIMLLFAGVCSAVEAPYHPRVMWTTNPQQEATIAWSSAVLGKKHVIYYDTQSRAGVLEDYAFQSKQDAEGAYSGVDKVKRIYYHHVRLHDLRPWTTYYFTIQGQRGETREYHFKTAPTNADQPIKIIVGGDSRSNRDDRRMMNELIAEQFENDEEIIAFCHGGDYVYSGTSVLQWMLWLRDHQLTYTKAGRILPIIPTRGNHEAEGEAYNQVFGWPGGENNYFATALSNSVLLVTLNTNINTDGDQQLFLEKTLRDAKETRWQVVNYHAAAYSAVKVPAPPRLNWVPLFEKYNIDLALESDGHTIKRTLPIRKDKHVVGGIVYVGEGGLGVEPRAPNKKLWYLQPPGKSGSGHHIQILSFNARRLNYTVLLGNGEIFDDKDFPLRIR